MHTGHGARMSMHVPRVTGAGKRVREEDKGEGDDDGGVVRVRVLREDAAEELRIFDAPWESQLRSLRTRGCRMSCRG